jgi:hypothetical protein
LLGLPLAMAALPVYVQVAAYYSAVRGVGLEQLGVVLFAARRYAGCAAASAFPIKSEPLRAMTGCATVFHDNRRGTRWPDARATPRIRRATTCRRSRHGAGGRLR